MAASFLGRYSRALARVTATLGVPFGYTLTVWASGALATHYFGIPDPVAVGAFVGGAVAAYLAFGAFEYPAMRVEEPLRARRVVIFNVVPIVAAAVVAVVDRAVDHALWGWTLSGAAATAAYITLLGVMWMWSAK